MKAQALEYQDGKDIMEGYLVSHEDDQVRPAVMISHAFSGLSDFEKQKAQDIAALGYNAFAIDIYGKGKRGRDVEESKQLMGTYMNDRALLRRRLLAALNAVQALDFVDKQRIAAMGFCFGGLCVLDLARAGANVKGVISIHGLFTPLPEALPNELIKAKVLALHGYEDPMAPPEQMQALASELTDAGVDWQIHAYGLTYHSFTNPKANDAAGGKMFSPVANQRANQAIENFLAEIFQ